MAEICPSQDKNNTLYVFYEYNKVVYIMVYTLCLKLRKKILLVRNFKMIKLLFHYKHIDFSPSHFLFQIKTNFKVIIKMLICPANCINRNLHL